ncbi:MAG: tetratricopeptide repeat protein [Bacteroidia bacterium]|nr:tetratricopeptide repeat protein [Bacteroidia bacterium]
MSKGIKYFFSVLLGMTALICFAQQPKTDSLLALLKKEKQDTGRIILLNKISREEQLAGNYDTSLYYGKAALQLSLKLNPQIISVKRCLAFSYANIGNAYRKKGDYDLGLEFYLKSLKIYEELNDKTQAAKCLGFIGIIYDNMGDYPKALGSYLKSLKIYEELNDKGGIARQSGNIGNIYHDQNNFEYALKYYFKALQMAEELGEKNIISAALSGIGNIYVKQDNYAKALEFELKALQLKEELGDREGVNIVLGNIGNVYSGMGNYENALVYFLKALKVAREIGDNHSIALHLANAGTNYELSKNFKQAEKILFEALALADSLGLKNFVKENYKFLSALYENTNIPLHDTIGGKLLTMEQTRLYSLIFHKRYISIRDTLFSEENKKELLRKEINYGFEKKELQQKAETAKQKVLNEEEKKKQRIIMFSVIGCLLVVVVFSVFLFNRFRIAKKQKNELGEKARIIAEQKLIVDEAFEKLREKNKEVMDSIYYARRIQRALITNEKYIERTLKKLSA